MQTHRLHLITSLSFNPFAFKTPNMYDGLQPSSRAAVLTPRYAFKDSSTFLSGTFSGWSLAPGSTGSLGAGTTLALDHTGTDVLLTVIPEPGTLGVALLGGLALLLRRRRG